MDVVVEAFDPHKIIADLERMASHPKTEKPLADESRKKADELRIKYNIPHGTAAPPKANVGRYYLAKKESRTFAVRCVIGKRSVSAGWPVVQGA